jgi:hypothetical protein
MPRRLLFLLPLVLVLTGCYTYTQAPGAVGKVMDADTGAPVPGARITRPFIAGGLRGRMGVPAEGLPAVTISTGKSGRFDLAPARHTQIAFMYLHNPASISGSFVISADGYATNELHGVATWHSLWRVDLGRVVLSKHE